MTMVDVLPWIAGGVVALGAAIYAMRRERKLSQNAWVVAATVSVLFCVWTVYAVIVEGPTGFWPEHTRNLWGNQIWFDLLLAVGIGWVLIVPRAKAVGMRPLVWLIFVLGTGCIGFTAMLARLLYLEARAVASLQTS